MKPGSKVALGGKRFQFSVTELRKLGTSFLLSLGGAALVLLSDIVGLIEWAPGSILAVFAPLVVNTLRKWGQDSRASWEKDL